MAKEHPDTRDIMSEQGRVYSMIPFSLWRSRILMSLPKEVEDLLNYGILPNKTKALVYMVEKGLVKKDYLYFTLDNKPSIPKDILPLMPLIVELYNFTPFRVICNNTGDTFKCEKPIMGEIPKEFFTFYPLWREGLCKLAKDDPDGPYKDAYKYLDSMQLKIRRSCKENKD